MFRKDAPFRLNPKPGCHKYYWLAEFAANIGNDIEKIPSAPRNSPSPRENIFSTLRIMKGSHHRYRKLRRACALRHG
jgi:hypothetical protein